jgi:hypothetical protein
MDDTLKIYVWPDGSWESEEDIDDMDWYLSSMGKSDDFSEHTVDLDLDYDDIQELIDLQALPGMLPDPVTINNIVGMGKIPVPKGAIVVVSHSKDIEYNAVTMLEDRLIVNAPDVFVEIIQAKVDKDV